MKYSRLIGVASALLLVGACLLPWAYFPDLQKSFTGFYSENNSYGRPGKILDALAVVAIILFLVPRIWAARTNIFVCAITLAFAVKCWILFGACYRGICPQRQHGLYLVLIATVGMIVAAVSPDIKLKEKKD